MTVPYEFPTASTVSVLLNGWHIDLAYRLDWRERKPKIPLYNYNADRFSKVAQGQGLVQGFLVVNFLYPGYLTEVLKIAKGGPVNRLAGTNLTNEVSVNNSVISKILDELDNLGTVSAQDKKTRIDTMASLLTANKGKDYDNIVNILRNKDIAAAGVRPKTGTAKIDKVLSPVHAKINNGNTLEVYYQDVRHVKWYSVFYDVEFTEITQQISAAGAEGSSEPLYEVCEFISSFRETNRIRVENDQ